MWNKPFTEVDEGDILSLKADEIGEGIRLEYKRDLPGGSNSDKKDFVREVCALANASGGRILFGIDEEEGVPKEVCGVEAEDMDDAILRLENVINSWTEPPIPGVHVRAIGDFDRGPVIAMEIPNSWVSPHMVAGKESARFYVRGSAGKRPMDLHQIRSGFVEAEGQRERIRQFRSDRIGKVLSGDTPVQISYGPTAILHLVPLISFSGGHEIDMKEMAYSSCFRPPGGNVNRTRFNLDGHVWCLPSGSYEDGAYCQVFRSGIVEGVSAQILSSRKDLNMIPSVSFEKNIAQATEKYLEGIRDAGVPLPVLIMLSLARMQGVKLAVHSRLQHKVRQADRSVLDLPDVVVREEDDGEAIYKLLRPVFDALWQSFGLQECGHYDDDGAWSLR